ncbi:MAG: pantoate--beta-alanine ligase [Lentisphaerae bacterium]|nr:pantoate--beta-alanine ligase [Lentisphaerota bacterium]
MQVIRDTNQMQAEGLTAMGGSRSALVPTMGALHEGHLSLIRIAHQHASRVVVSIFVNPSQFGPGEDLERYPRMLEQDLEACQREGVTTVFCPEVAQMYADDHSTQVSEFALSVGLCGAQRPGHFSGVTTVVAKLFNMVRPTVAIFGRKDYQQARVIQRMTRDLNFPIEIVLAPIVREADGLAMSSRNRHLSVAERERALSISRALQAARTRFHDRPDVAAPELVESVGRSVSAAGVVIQYVTLVDANTLDPVSAIAQPALLAVAASVGGTRLIDNVELVPPRLK